MVLAIAAAACTETPEPVTQCVAGLRLDVPLLVLESDLATASALARVDRDGCLTERSSVALGGDPSLAISGGRFFVAIRDRSRIAEVDPAGPWLIEGRQFDVPPVDVVTNPHDVAVASDGTLWVPRYNMTSLAILDEGGALLDEIDLSAFADEDGTPEMESAIAIGDRVYVALERLSWTGARYETENDSLIVALDVASRSVVGTIPLQGRVPFGRLVPAPDDEGIFYAAVPGTFDSIDERDGIERIDTRTGTSELAISETALGGSVSELAIASENEAYALVATDETSNDTSLVRFDPQTGNVTGSWATTTGRYGLWGLAIAGDDVVVGDRERTAPRLRIFDRKSGVERGSIPLGVLPPVSIATY